MFQIKVVDKIKTHILYSIVFPRKSCRLRDNAEKCGRAREAADDDTIWRISVVCWISKATRECTRPPTQAPIHTHTHTHTRTQVHSSPTLELIQTSKPTSLTGIGIRFPTEASHFSLLEIR